MITQYVTRPKVLRRMRSGPLGIHLDGFADMLSDQGYRSSTAALRIRLVAALSRWMIHSGVKLRDLNEARILRFLRDRSHTHQAQKGDKATLRELLQFLRAAGIIPRPLPNTQDTHLRRIERDFVQYLVQERGLAPVTIDQYLAETRCFLNDCEAHGTTQLNRLCSRDVNRFILRQANKISPRRAKLAAGILRGFFRFLRQRGEIQVDLAAVVPSVANWRFSATPKFLEPEEVERLLQVCDQRTSVGRRNYAILLLLARLGLRVGEVTKMVLEDIDWAAGELLVHGKGGRQDRLPVPKDVGQAVADYIRCDRPPCVSRRVFLRSKAPYRGFASSVAIEAVVARTLAKAGLHPEHRGAHLLRHSLATKMLRRGLSLPEIGQILRHEDINTTQIYAKVDLATLRSLAQPWPGGVS